MSRIIRALSKSLSLWTVLGVALLTLASASACGGSVSNNGNPGGGGQTASGALNVIVTDAPADDWQEVSVVLKSISLRNQSDHSWSDVWVADAAQPDSAKINLVDLSGVSEILGKATIPVGTYDRLQLTINTDPSTMTLVDDGGTTYTGSAIKVVDPSGKGQIGVTIDPAITVAEGTTTNLQVDFDLTHPLSLVVQNGMVLLDLQLHCKPIHGIHEVQFARHLGTVTATTDAGFTLHTLRGKDLNYGVDANTIYFDVDAKSAGSQAGLIVGKAAMVASNLNADGTLYARRIWYAADVATLPRFSPEGLVRRVDAANNQFSILRPNQGSRHWEMLQVTVDDNTSWTYRTTAMGTGTALLANIWRGVRVNVELVDPAATPKIAKSIDVQEAHDGGFITAATDTELTFGWNGWQPRTWSYSTDTDHPFSWWFYGLPSGASTSPTALVGAVTQAQGADLWVMGRAELTWDSTTSAWVVENLILAPEMLPHPSITKGYNDASLPASAMQVTYTTPDPSMMATQTADMTVLLDTTGDLQTVVESLVWNGANHTLTFTVPVDPSQWQTLLQPANLTALRIWVRPQLNADNTTYSWHAYTVFAIQVQ